MITDFAVWKNATKERVAECTLRLCERKYEAFNVTSGSVTNSHFDVNELVFFSAAVSATGGRENIFNLINIVYNTTTGNNYTVNLGDIDGIKSMFPSTFSFHLFSESKLNSRDMFGLQQDIYNTENVTAMAEALSNQLTDYIRSVDPVRLKAERMGDDNPINATFDTISSVQGTAFHSEIYIQINWSWFIFPAGVVSIAALLLLLAVYSNWSHRGPLWKSSSLPYLYHPLESKPELEDDAPEPVHSSTTLNRMERAAGATRVQLRTSNGGKLVFVREAMRST